MTPVRARSNLWERRGSLYNKGFFFARFFPNKKCSSGWAPFHFQSHPASNEQRDKRATMPVPPQEDPLTGPRVYLELKWGNRRMGRVVISLRKDACPKTAENFRALCTGEKGRGRTTGVPLHYKSCPIHRVVPGFMLQVRRRSAPPPHPRGGGGGCASVCYSTVCVLPNVHFMFYATSAAFPSRVFIQSISGGRLLKEGRHRRRVHLRRQVCGRELRPVPLVTGDDEHGQRGTQHQRLAILHHSQGTRWKKKPIAFST